MDGHLRLSTEERKTCLATLRAARAARRALILLLLAEVWSYRPIGGATWASPTLIAAVKRDLAAGGVARVLGEGPRPYVVAWWLLHFAPQDFGFFRSRWSCGLLALLLWEREGIRLRAETVRRGLVRMEFVWRRPRPVVGPRDPQHAAKVRRIQRLIANLPAGETAVFQDEADLHLNPKIGGCWMVRGEQAQVVTPGNNQKRHLKLTQVILAEAFRGELVPTEAELARREGRPYEPASALLDRIQSEWAKHEARAVTTRSDGRRTARKRQPATQRGR